VGLREEKEESQKQSMVRERFFWDGVEQWLRWSLKQISQMIVQEAARRVQFSADCSEIVKARIERRHVFRAIEMQLAPMRPPCRSMQESKSSRQRVSLRL
jgi:hypothetical protein